MTNSPTNRVVGMVTTEVNEYLINTNDTSQFSQHVTAMPSLIVSVIGVIANTLVIVVICFGSLRRSVFMTLLMTLAITDNITLVFTTLIQPDFFGWIFGHSLLFCRLFAFILISSGVMSSWLIVLVSIERFIAVYYPLKVHIYFSMKRTYIAVSVTAILMCINSVYYVLAFKVFIIRGVTTCHLDKIDIELDFIFTIFNSLLYSIIPFCIITVLNILTVKNIKSQRAFRARAQQQNQHVQDYSLEAMMLSISFVFALTTFPITMFVIVTRIIKYVNTIGNEWNAFNDWGFMAALVLSNVNNGMNFFLYCLTGSVFRKSLVCFLRCKKKHLVNSSQHVAVISENVV